MTVLVNTGIAGGTLDYVTATAIQTDGKILAAGYSQASGNNDFALVRYNADGTLDLTFGGGDGIVTTAIGTSSDIANGLILHANGKILLAGTSFISGANDIAMVQYNSDGTLDTSFGGGDGIANSGISGSDEGNSVAIQSDGKIVVGGT